MPPQTPHDPSALALTSPAATRTRDRRAARFLALTGIGTAELRRRARRPRPPRPAAGAPGGPGRRGGGDAGGGAEGREGRGRPRFGGQSPSAPRRIRAAVRGRWVFGRPLASVPPGRSSDREEPYHPG